MIKLVPAGQFPDIVIVFSIYPSEGIVIVVVFPEVDTTDDGICAKALKEVARSSVIGTSRFRSEFGMTELTCL